MRATGTLTGYKSASSVSNGINGATGDALVAAYPPTVNGDARVGQTLTVVPATWPETTSPPTYQWYRDGVLIDRATSATYRLVSADLSHDVHVVETARVAGRDPGTAASDPVSVVPSGTLVATSNPTLTGTPAVGQTLQASNGTWNNSAQYRYTWLATAR